MSSRDSDSSWNVDSEDSEHASDVLADYESASMPEDSPAGCDDEDESDCEDEAQADSDVETHGGHQGVAKSTPQSTSDTKLLPLKMPLKTLQARRIRLYGRAPNPTMSLNGTVYVLQRRQRPRKLKTVLREDTFVVVRLGDPGKGSVPKKAIARVVHTLDLPTLNESFDIDRYMVSTRVELELFDEAKRSSDDTIIGRIIFFKRPEKETFVLADITSFAEVFRPHDGDLALHGVIPGANTILELACTENHPSTAIPYKLWRRAKLFTIRATLTLGPFPVAPLFLIPSERLFELTACKISDTDIDVGAIHAHVKEQAAVLTSLSSQPLLSYSAIDVCQRLEASVLKDAADFCATLDNIWANCHSMPFFTGGNATDFSAKFLSALLCRSVTDEALVSELKVVVQWCMNFAQTLDELGPDERVQRSAGKSFLEWVFPSNTQSKGLFIPSWAHAFASEITVSEILLEAAYNYEHSTAGINRSSITSLIQRGRSLQLFQSDLLTMHGHVFQLWLSSLDTAVYAGNTAYVHFIMSKGKTNKGNLFAPLGLISLSETLLFSQIDFEVTNKQILSTPQGVSRLVNTTPMNWVMLGGNMDMINAFADNCILDREPDSSDSMYIGSVGVTPETAQHNLYAFSAAGHFKGFQSIPKLLVKYSYAPVLAVILGAMGSRSVSQFVEILDIVHKTRPSDPVWQVAPANRPDFPVVSIVKEFINHVVMKQAGSADVKAMLDGIRQLFEPQLYHLFTVTEKIDLLGGVLSSNISEDDAIQFVGSLLPAEYVLYTSQSQSVLQHCIEGTRLHVASYLLYDLYIDPFRGLSGWTSALGSYTDEIIIHFIGTLFSITTAGEYELLTTALRDHVYATLIHQKRFESLRAISGYVKNVTADRADSIALQAKPLEEDIIAIYLKSQRSDANRISLSQKLVDDAVSLVDIFGELCLSSGDRMFSTCEFNVDDMVNKLAAEDGSLSLDDLANLTDQFMSASIGILHGLAHFLLGILTYYFKPVTEEERSRGITRPPLDFMLRPSVVLLSTLGMDGVVNDLYERIEQSLTACQVTADGTGDDKLASHMYSIEEDSSAQVKHAAQNALSALSAFQSTLKSLLTTYNDYLRRVSSVTARMHAGVERIDKNAAKDYFVFLLLQGAVTKVFGDSVSVHTIGFMRRPSIANSTSCIVPFGLDLLSDINIDAPTSKALAQLNVYPPATLVKEMLCRLLRIDGFVNLRQSPLPHTSVASTNTALFNVPIVQQYYQLISGMRPAVSIPVPKDKTIPDQIHTVTEAYVNSTGKDIEEFGDMAKDPQNRVLCTKKFVDKDLLKLQQRPDIFRGSTALHILFSKFDLTKNNPDFPLLLDILRLVVGLYPDQAATCVAFSSADAAFKTPLQLVRVNSLEHAVSFVRGVHDVEPVLLSPHASEHVDLPSLIHHIIFELVSNTPEQVISQILALAPKTVMRDLLMAPCYAYGDAIILTALLKKGVDCVDHLITLYQQYGCLDDAAVKRDSSGWCAVTVALQNTAIQEVPAALVDAAMKVPMEALANAYGHTPLHCLFFDQTLVSQSPGTGEQYTYTYGVLSNAKVDPVFKLSVAQRLARMEDSEGAMFHLDKFGMSPLHYSVASSAFVCTQYLLAKDCPVQLVDKTGLANEITPLELALAKGAEEMAQLLIQKGANPLRKTSVTSFYGEPLTVFARLIQSNYLNLAYAIIHQCISVGQLLPNEALHASSPNAKPVLRTLLSKVDESSVPYLALSIAGGQLDRKLMDTMLDTIQCMYFASKKKFHLTNWLAAFYVASPSRWFSGDDSIYSLFTKIATIANYAENSMEFNQRLVSTNVPVRIVSKTLNVSSLVSSVNNRSTDSNTDKNADDEVLFDKPSPFELMLLKLYTHSFPSVFKNSEFLTLFQTYICKHLHIAPIIPRILDDFLTCILSCKLTPAKVTFFSNFFAILIELLDTDECSIPGLTVRMLRMRTKDFITKLLVERDILTKLFEILTFSSYLQVQALDLLRNTGGMCVRRVLGQNSAGSGSGSPGEDPILCCMDILKAYIATNSVSWPLLFASIYGLNTELRQSPTKGLQIVFDQLKSKTQVPRPAKEAVLQAAVSCIRSLYRRGNSEDVVKGYLVELLELADASDSYDKFLSQVLGEADSEQPEQQQKSNTVQLSEEALKEADAVISEAEQSYNSNKEYIARHLLGPEVNLSIGKRNSNSKKVFIPCIDFNESSDSFVLNPRKFIYIPCHSSLVLHTDGAPLRINNTYYQFMLSKVLLSTDSSPIRMPSYMRPATTLALISYHDYQLRFNEGSGLYTINYRFMKQLITCRGGCWSPQDNRMWTYGKEIMTFATPDQAIKGFCRYFQKKTGLNFDDCCANGVPKEHYERIDNKGLTVCGIGTRMPIAYDSFIEVTPAVREIVPDILLQNTANIIANKLNSDVVNKVMSAAGDSWQALKLIASLFTAGSYMEFRGTLTSYEEPCLAFQLAFITQLLERYTKDVLPLLESPDFRNLVSSLDALGTTSGRNTASTALIQKALNMSLNILRIAGLPPRFFTICIPSSELAVLNLKTYFAHLRAILANVQKSTLMCLAGMRCYAKLGVTASLTDEQKRQRLQQLQQQLIAVIRRIYGLELRPLDSQSKTVITGNSHFGDNALLYRICGCTPITANDPAYAALHELVPIFVEKIAQGRECSTESEDKEWSGPHLLWLSGESVVLSFTSLLTRLLVPLGYEGSHSFGKNYEFAPPYGVILSSDSNRYSHLGLGGIVSNVSSFAQKLQEVEPDTLKAIPGALRMPWVRKALHTFSGDGFSYILREQSVNLVSYTPNAIQLQYVMFM